MAMEELDVPERTGEGIWVAEELDIVQIYTPINRLTGLRDPSGKAIADRKYGQVDQPTLGPLDRVIQPRIDKEWHVDASITFTDQ